MVWIHQETPEGQAAVERATLRSTTDEIKSQETYHSSQPVWRQIRKWLRKDLPSVNLTKRNRFLELPLNNHFKKSFLCPTNNNYKEILFSTERIS